VVVVVDDDDDDINDTTKNSIQYRMSTMKRPNFNVFSGSKE
jgi:hypothetical protein